MYHQVFISPCLHLHVDTRDICKTAKGISCTCLSKIFFQCYHNLILQVAQAKNLLDCDGKLPRCTFTSSD